MAHLARIVSRSLSGARPALPVGGLAAPAVASQVRWLNIHEYQGAELMRSAGVNVPPGIACSTPEEVARAAAKMDVGVGQVVVKSQILAGGRGLGKFTSGLQGGVHIVKTEEAEPLAHKMLGQTLVTKQSGPGGKPVNTLLVAQKMNLVNEMYFAILLDRATAGPMIIACSEGGTSIEDLAAKSPEKIVKIPLDLSKPISDEQLNAAADGLQVTTDRAAAKDQIRALYELFVKEDCTMLEVNPLAESKEGVLMAADAKMNFDDNSSFRHKELHAMKDTTQEDPREVQAHKHDLNYIGLDGNIGCMVNGAGLAMATMDIISLYGGKPANFLDVGGAANEDQIVEAFKILTEDPQVKAIMVNIFGGIMKCDVIAQGIVNGAEKVGLNVPMIVRLEGTNVEQGKRILEESGVKGLQSAQDLDDCAQKAVKALA